MQATLETKIEAALGEELRVIAATLRDQLDPMIPEDDLESRIGGVVPNRSPMVYRLFRKA